jgi:hypothetical protein
VHSHKQAFPVPVYVTRFLVKLFEAVLQRLAEGKKVNWTELEELLYEVSFKLRK